MATTHFFPPATGPKSHRGQGRNKSVRGTPHFDLDLWSNPSSADNIIFNDGNCNYHANAIASRRKDDSHEWPSMVEGSLVYTSLTNSVERQKSVGHVRFLTNALLDGAGGVYIYYIYIYMTSVNPPCKKLTKQLIFIIFM